MPDIVTGMNADAEGRAFADVVRRSLIEAALPDTFRRPRAEVVERLERRIAGSAKGNHAASASRSAVAKQEV